MYVRLKSWALQQVNKNPGSLQLTLTRHTGSLMDALPDPSRIGGENPLRLLEEEVRNATIIDHQ